MAPLLEMLTRAVIKIDRELNDLQSQDSFVFFLGKDNKALLPQLVQQAQQWHQAKKENQQPQATTPLRLHLMRHVASRMTKVQQAEPQAALRLAAVKKNILLEDGTWPFLQWNPAKMQMEVATKPALTPKKMEALCTQLVESLRNEESVIQFPHQHTDQVIPWRLKVSMRDADTHAALTQLSNNAVWSLLGASMKTHMLSQSRICQNLQQWLPKGQGKGKSKTKQHKQP